MNLYLNNKDLYKVRIDTDVNQNDIFYSTVYEQAGEQIEIILNTCNIYEDELRVFENVENPNNILGFVGDRGQGKTSAMLSFKNFLIGKSEELFGDRIDKYHFQELGVIDPSSFEDYSNLISIILARMYSKFKNEYENRIKRNNSEREFKEDKINMLKQFQIVYNHLNMIMGKGNTEHIDIYEQALENLTVLGDASDLKKSLSSLISLYLRFMNDKSSNNVLLITIDDLDLNIKHSYQIIEQIRKYLIIPKVVILLAVKVEQLHLGIRTEYSKHLKNENESYKMATTYLRKILPESRRIFMPELCNDTGDIMNDIQLEINGKNSNLKDTISELLYEKTNIVAMNFGKRKRFLFSGNLRELIELYALLKDLVNPNVNDKEQKYKIYLSNIKKFKDYFIYNWCYTNLNPKESEYIKQIDKYSVFMKNRKVLKILKKIMNESNVETPSIDDIFKKKGSFDQFYSLSEVYDELENFKKNDYRLKIEHNGKFIYAIQMYYSIIMNQLYFIDEVIDKSNDSYLTDSYQINHLSQFVAGKIMGNEFYVEDNKINTIDNLKSVGNLNINRNFEQQEFCGIDLFTFLVGRKQFDNKNLAVYSNTGWYNYEYNYDFFNMFFRGLDLNYSCLMIINLKNEEKEKMKKRDLLELVQYSQVYEEFKEPIENVSRYIVCNFDVYAFYNRWITDHVKNLPYTDNCLLNSYIKLMSNFLGQLENDVKTYFNFESQNKIISDIQMVRKFLSSILNDFNKFLYYPKSMYKVLTKSDIETINERE